MAGVGILERDGEVAQLDALLQDARAGRGRLAVLEGPAGIGKTSVLAAVRADAERAGMTVLRARGADLEREYAFGVVRQLFEPLLAGAGASERAEWLDGAAGLAVARLGLVSGEAEDEAGLPDATFAVLHGLYWLVANLAHRGPLLLIVDDAHWADAASLRFLAFLATRLEELPVACCVATRPEADGDGAELLAALATDPTAALLRPAPLSRAAVTRIIEAELAVPPDPAFAAACHSVTGGTPFFVRQLVGALREEAVIPTAAAAGAVERLGARSVRRWLMLRLARLPESAGRLARALAILESAPLQQAAALAGLEPGVAGAAADRLVAAGILAAGRPLAFEHAVVRAGIYEELPTLERAAGHRRAAELLAAEPDGGARMAEHLLAAEPAGDAWVSERLAVAARAAARSGAPESAVAYLTRALAEPPPESEQGPLLLALGLAEVSAGRGAAEQHLAAAATQLPGAAALEAALLQAQLLARDDRCAEALACIDATAAGTRDPVTKLVLDIAAVSIALLDVSTAAAVQSRADELRALADDPGATRELLGVAAYIAGTRNEPAQVTRRLARRCLDAGPRPLPTPSDLPWFPQATVALFYAEGYRDAQTALDAAVGEARAIGDGVLFAVTSSQRAWVLLRRGDLSGAELDARAALETPALPAPPIYQALACGVLVASLQEQGYLLHADAAMAPFTALAEAETQTSAVLRFARGQLRVEQGKLREGLEDLLAVGRIAAHTRTPSPGVLPWRSAAAVAHLALGERGEAERLAAEEVELARALGAPRALGIALRTAGMVAEGKAAAALLEEAVAVHEQGDAAIELVKSRLEHGALLRRANRRGEARDVLRAALDEAHRTGAKPLAARAEVELRATGAKPRRVVLSGVDSLTASERRIATLAAEGLTNREIAQTLYVTARTVEGHLTSVFRKLDVDSRDQLPALMAGSGTGQAAA